MLIRLCGYGGNGNPNEIICGEYQQLWPLIKTNKKYMALVNSCAFANKYQGDGSHWLEHFKIESIKTI